VVTFRKRYFLITLLLFLIEISIATFVHDNIVRPYVGDFLVVILIYCFLRAFFNIKITVAAIATLLFAFTVELLQYLNIIQILGLQDSRIMNIVLGNLFEWIDLLAYALGICLVLIIEKTRSASKKIKVQSTEVEPGNTLL
jgi:hypothetical protein